jgi:hypothetical protein
MNVHATKAASARTPVKQQGCDQLDRSLAAFGCLYRCSAVEDSHVMC